MDTEKPAVRDYVRAKVVALSRVQTLAAEVLDLLEALGHDDTWTVVVSDQTGVPTGRRLVQSVREVYNYARIEADRLDAPF